MQINIGHLNEEGVYITGQFSTFALVGAVRAQVGCPLVPAAGALSQSAGHLHAGACSRAFAGLQPCSPAAHAGFTLKVRKHASLCAVQGEGDSAIDLLWQKRRQEVGQ